MTTPTPAAGAPAPGATSASTEAATAATPPALAPGSRHPIHIRAPRIDFDGVPHHWLGGNAIATHVFNGLNLVFPDGERFFIESVRAALPRVQDPELQRQVRGFFGQEGRHAHEHERYFAALEAQGYEIAPFLRRFRRFVALTTRWSPAPLRLAITAGAEHYTAIFGAFALRDDLIDRAHPSLRKLILWHATEEIEHKAVAFDVLQAAWPSHALRVTGYAMATLDLFGWSMAGTRMLIRQDLAAGRVTKAQLAEMRRELASRRRSEGPLLWQRAREYLRRDFHPNRVDDLALAHQRLVELGIEQAA